MGEFVFGEIRMFRIAFLSFLLLAQVACDRGRTPEPAGARDDGRSEVAAPVAAPALQVAREAFLVEVPTQALPSYRELEGASLVLLSNDPFLAPVPEPLRGEVVSSLRGGGDRWQRRLGRVADPLIMPDMLVSAALDAGLFSRIVWVVPSSDPEEKIDPEKFAGLLSSVGRGEAGSFKPKEDGTLSGELQGVRFDVVHSSALPALKGPVALHLELGYFMRLYRGEIKTPLLPLLGSTLVELRKTGWDVAAVTVSLSNHTGRVPLPMRFVGPILQRIFAEPQLLDEPLPEKWNSWGKILYLENFFQNEEMLRLLEAMRSHDSGDAGVLYASYRLHSHMGRMDEAGDFLDEAVRIDPAYALEYLALAEEAGGEERLRLLKKFYAAHPDDPIFALTLVQELTDQGRFADALPEIKRLKELPWSPAYYPEVLPALADFEEKARSHETAGR